MRYKDTEMNFIMPLYGSWSGLGLGLGLGQYYNI